MFSDSKGNLSYLNLSLWRHFNSAAIINGWYLATNGQEKEERWGGRNKRTMKTRTVQNEGRSVKVQTAANLHIH
jgi:hypothetical protein